METIKSSLLGLKKPIISLSNRMKSNKMKSNKITTLTPAQAAKIPLYRDKWKSIRCQTQPINRIAAADAIKAAYSLIGHAPPELIFADGPKAAFKDLSQIATHHQRQKTGIKHLLNAKLNEEFSRVIWQQSEKKIDFSLLNRVYNESRVDLDNWGTIAWIERVQSNNISPELWKTNSLNRENVHPHLWLNYYSWFDLCIHLFNCDFHQPSWEVLQAIVHELSWIFTLDKYCIVCERPIKILFDQQQLLHAEGDTAIEFADGLKIYANHGVFLPEKYGNLLPDQWQAHWLIGEENAQLRRLLIQNIGYARICQELTVAKLDCWEEYTLLKIIDNVDFDPIYLLKMVCPSTGFVYVLRVPPQIQTAREAIRWVNWGTDPEDFAVQT